MDRIRKIVKEEIERYLINEGITSLDEKANSLTSLVQKLGQLEQTQNQRVNKYVEDMLEYTVQVINAVKKCSYSGNINESFRDYGLNIPDALGGNFFNDFQRGFYNTWNFINRMKGGNNNARSASSMQRNVPSEKLSVLMEQLQDKYDQYRVFVSREDMQHTCPRHVNILNEIYTELFKTREEYLALVSRAQQTQQAQ